MYKLYVFTLTEGSPYHEVWYTALQDMEFTDLQLEKYKSELEKATVANVLVVQVKLQPHNEGEKEK